MSDIPTPVVEPLWSNEKMKKCQIHLNPDDDWGDLETGGLALPMGVARQMRDEYEEKLNQYQAVYIYYIEQAQKDQEQLDKLRRQLVAQEQWEPLLNGKHDKIAGRTSIEIRADMIILENRDSILTAVLPDHIRLCRRKAQEHP